MSCAKQLLWRFCKIFWSWDSKPQAEHHLDQLCHPRPLLLLFLHLECPTSIEPMPGFVSGIAIARMLRCLENADLKGNKERQWTTIHSMNGMPGNDFQTICSSGKARCSVQLLLPNFAPTTFTLYFKTSLVFYSWLYSFFYSLCAHISATTPNNKKNIWEFKMEVVGEIWVAREQRSRGEKFSQLQDVQTLEELSCTPFSTMHLPLARLLMVLIFDAKHQTQTIPNHEIDKATNSLTSTHIHWYFDWFFLKLFYVDFVSHRSGKDWESTPKLDKEFHSIQDATQTWTAEVCHLRCI